MVTPVLTSDVPELRIRTVHRAEVSGQGVFVLYWMIANRRGNWNYSLQRAVDWSRELGKPLVILEALRCGYRWASDRIHHFVIQGMAANAAEFAKNPVTYYPYLEPQEGAGSGLLKSLAKRAAVVVSDDFPCFFLPRMVAVAARQVSVRFELVDSNGLLPMRAAEQVFARAYDFRRFLQKNLKPHLADAPKRSPLSRIKLPTLPELPQGITKRWPTADVARLAADASLLNDFPIDHTVYPGMTEGGSQAAQAQLRTFLKTRLGDYGELRNEPQQQVTSELSPYLHFGHISVHQVFSEVMQQESWTPDKISEKANGSRSGWWGTSETTESYLDELITWRELGYNMCWQRDDYDRYSSLPDWAQETLAEHSGDPREYVYSLEQFEKAETHNELWNAAQRQLVREGRIHNYLRMLWGKKILHWSESPQAALEIMIELNNKYAVDGRNPNSYSGIFWVLGRYDRAWGPERPIFGKIRYMTCENTARKVKVDEYLRKYAAESQQELFD